MRHAASLALLCCCISAEAGPRRRGNLVVPIRVRVAACVNKEVRGETWLKAHIASTRRIFGKHGIRLDVVRESFSPERCALLDARQRHALAPHVSMDGRATVLVVERVRDLDVKSYNLMGVHWRYRGKDTRLRGRRWVLLTARARPPVLAHELAHYFGLRHDRAGGNLMTPGPSDPSWRTSSPPKPFKARFTKAQAKRLRRVIKRWLKR